jgi:hypothetical protein
MGEESAAALACGMALHRAVVRPRLGAASLLLALAGCGGGFFFVGVGDIGFDSSPPSVTLTTVDSAAPGETVRLSAAAADDFGIDQVAFYREEGIDLVVLSADGTAPYETDTQIPLNAISPVTYLAIATDIDGNSTQSPRVAVRVVP